MSLLGPEQADWNKRGTDQGNNGKRQKQHDLAHKQILADFTRKERTKDATINSHFSDKRFA